MFEEEYNALIKSGKYLGFGNASTAHDGYFQLQEENKSGVEYNEFKDTKGNTNADDETFNKIRKIRKNF